MQSHGSYHQDPQISGTDHRAGSEQGYFYEPAGLACDGEHVYVADKKNRRLQKLRMPGYDIVGACAEAAKGGARRGAEWAHGGAAAEGKVGWGSVCLLYTSPSPRDS